MIMMNYGYNHNINLQNDMISLIIMSSSWHLQVTIGCTYAFPKWQEAHSMLNDSYLGFIYAFSALSKGSYRLCVKLVHFNGGAICITNPFSFLAFLIFQRSSFPEHFSALYPFTQSYWNHQGLIMYTVPLHGPRQNNGHKLDIYMEKLMFTFLMWKNKCPL